MTRTALGILWVAAAAAWLAACPAAAADDDIVHTPDIVYGRCIPDGAPSYDLVLDAYLPAKTDPAPRPALLLFHGNPGDAPYPGGRQHGFRNAAEYFVRHGYCAFVPAYAFFGTEQAKTAVRHLRANAAQYHIDPNRIAALGHSLGSNLSMRLAVTGEDHAPLNEKEKADPANHWGVSARVNAAILVGGGSGPHPIDQLDSGDPPICFVHGTADDTAPIENALARCQLVSAANIPYAFLRVEGLKHAVPDTGAVVAFGKTFGEFVDAFLRIYMDLDAPNDWAALHIVKPSGVDIQFVPEHALYPNGQEVEVIASTEAAGKSNTISTLKIVMDKTKRLSFPFDATLTSEQSTKDQTTVPDTK